MSLPSRLSSYPPVSVGSPRVREAGRPLAPPHLAGVCPNQVSFPPQGSKEQESLQYIGPCLTHHSSCGGVEFLHKSPPSPPPPLLCFSYLLDPFSSLSLASTCPLSSLVWALDCMSLCPPHTFQVIKHHQRPPASCFELLSDGPNFVPFDLELRPSRTPSDPYSRLELWHLGGPLGPWQIITPARVAPGDWVALSPNLEGPGREVSPQILNSIHSNFLESLQNPKVSAQCNPDKVNPLHLQ